MKQASFLPKLGLDTRMDHGGELRSGKRKTARPFSHKHAIHVVLRSNRAKGAWSLLTRANERLTERLLEQFKKRYRIRVYRYVNVGNHLHLLLKTEARQHDVAKADFQNFLRRFAGAVAFEVTGAKKARPKGGFWEKLAYSRLIEWGRQYKNVRDYFTKNFFESRGLWGGREDAWITPWRLSMIAAGVGPPLPRARP